MHAVTGDKGSCLTAPPISVRTNSFVKAPIVNTSMVGEGRELQGFDKGSTGARRAAQVVEELVRASSP